MPFICSQPLSETDQTSPAYKKLLLRLISPTKAEVTKEDIFILNYMHDVLGKKLISYLNQIEKLNQIGDVNANVELKPLFYTPLLKCMDKKFIDTFSSTIARDPNAAQRVFAFFFQENIATFNSLVYSLIRTAMNRGGNTAREMAVHCVTVIQSLFWTEDQLFNNPMHPIQRYTHVNISAKRFFVGSYLAYLFNQDILDMVKPLLRKKINTSLIFQGLEDATRILSPSYINKLYYHALFYPLDDDTFIPLLCTTNFERFLKHAFSSVAKQILEDKFKDEPIQCAIRKHIASLKKLHFIEEENELGRDKKTIINYATMFSQKPADFEEKSQERTDLSL